MELFVLAGLSRTHRKPLETDSGFVQLLAQELLHSGFPAGLLRGQHGLDVIKGRNYVADWQQRQRQQTSEQ